MIRKVNVVIWHHENGLSVEPKTWYVKHLSLISSSARVMSC